MELKSLEVKMDNGNRPAMAFSYEWVDHQGGGHTNQDVYLGLTKREHFAAMAMQGMLANTDSKDWSMLEVCADSISYADSLLKALENKEC